MGGYQGKDEKTTNLRACRTTGQTRTLSKGVPESLIFAARLLHYK